MNRVQIVGKPGCHLCEQAEEVVQQVCLDLGIGWESISIFDDSTLADRFAEFIPVILIDGKVHDQFSVSAQRLRSALLGQTD